MNIRAIVRMLMVVSLLAAVLAQPVMADRNVPPEGGQVPQHLLEPRAPSIVPRSPTRMTLLAALDAVPDVIITDPLLDMRVLVILDSDPVTNENLVILDYLDILGIPYDVWDVDGDATIEDTDLWDGVRHGYYYAVFVSTNLVWDPGLTVSERTLIDTYERRFGVRRVTWQAWPWPPEVYGLTAKTGWISTPIDMKLTLAGQNVFDYLQPSATLSITGTNYILSSADALSGGETTPLLVDPLTGHTILAIYRPGDGREHMVMTASSDHIVALPSNVHAHTLPYGIINWATKGVFLGERHFYFVPQPDDVFAWGDHWNADTHGVDEDDYRLRVTDLDNLVAWMHTMTTTVPNAADFKIEMPFNGEGTEEDRENRDNRLSPPRPGTLTQRAVDLQKSFVWLNHTYTHFELYEATAARAYTETLFNTEAAINLGFLDYTTRTLLTGSYAGITNTDVITTIYDLGVRHLLVNWSVPEYRNPSPNTGIPHPDEPDLLQVPRYANNVFYYSTTPVEQHDAYNFMIDPRTGPYCPTYNVAGGWVPCFTYEEIVELITNQALGFMLDFSINPTMFHMNNLNQYSETMSNTLMGDFVESLYGKYNALYNDDVPILSLRTQEIGERMWERMDYDVSDVSGVIGCGNWITVTYPTFSGAPSPVRVPLTGIEYGDDHEGYAGQDISYLSMAPGKIVTITGEAPTTPAKVQNLLVAAVSGGNELRWDAITADTAGAPMTALAYRVYRGSVANFTLGEPITTTASTVYTDTEGAAGQYYAVIAVGDDCWKRSSEPAYTAGPTAVGPIGLDARSGLWGGWVPGLLLLTLWLVRRRDVTRPNGP